MNPTDPALPISFLIITLIGFSLGYLSGHLAERRRQRQRPTWKRP